MDFLCISTAFAAMILPIGFEGPLVVELAEMQTMGLENFQLWDVSRAL